MIINVIKLKGRPKKDARFNLTYGQWLSLEMFGMVKIGGYLLRIKGR